MEIIKYPDRNSWSKILSRPGNQSASIEEQVKVILNDIKEAGDAAVKEYSTKFDKVVLDNLIVTEKEISNAIFMVDETLKSAIDIAAKNIEKFHEAQIDNKPKIETSKGVICWQKSTAIEKVGLYIPGGTAPLFSTILMLGIPAQIAGCKEIIMCSPPNKEGKLHPAMLYAAKAAGISKIFKIGGVQAIGAMAYGTDSVPKIYKIFGPGNQYVTVAKQIVSRSDVAIDMPAGPSEVAVMADETSNPVFIASDLLAQAEHGNDSQVILVTNSEKKIEEVIIEVEKQLKELPRKIYAENSLKNSKLILVNNNQIMLDIINEYAPEHLIISTSNADKLSENIINAGSVFVGEYTPESAGDYASGTNHTLPTYGYAKAYNGVNLDDYVKKITFQKISKQGLLNIGPAVEIMAETEELTAHKNAVTVRLNQIKKNEEN